MFRAALIVVAVLASARDAEAQATPACTWPGDVPAVWDLDEGTLTSREVISRIESWLDSLRCDAETAPIRALLDGAHLVGREIVYSEAAIAAARADLVAHAPACAASWARGELRDPLVVADSCGYRGTELVPFGATWTAYAVIWSLRRRVEELVLLEADGDEVQGHAASSLAQLLEWYSDSDSTRGTSLAAGDRDPALARLEEWVASWPPSRIDAMRRRAEICSFEPHPWDDPVLELVEAVHIRFYDGLDVEEAEELAFIFYLSLARETASWAEERDERDPAEAGSEAWAAMSRAFSTEAERLCEGAATP